jgi:hypothetical protein
MNDSMPSPQTASQINTPQTGRVTLPPPTHVAPAQAAPHPLRCAIRDVTDRIDDLQTFVSAQDLDPDLKQYMLAELGELPSNAACINLHIVTRPNGGFDLHLSIAAVQLGSRPGAVTIAQKLTKAQE